ncbi:MAG: YmdB family metallophosphoesterase [Clostridia bacterium]|nr:YmdB family metallophosphoesterase [Clostridia bacterium]
MNVLCLGDVVGQAGVDDLLSRLPAVRRELRADLVIVNGENASMGRGNGMTAEDVKDLFMAGADVITGGNHTFRQRNVYELLDDSVSILRPANYPPANPGRGSSVVRISGRDILVVNLAGRVGMEPAACPFETFDRIVAEEKRRYDFIAVDFHAEATSEKVALGHYVRERAAIFFGTHTHVQTADERILEGGCGYITDLGMCGPSCSALGLKTELIVWKFRTGMPCRFELADTPCRMEGALFTLDDRTYRCTAVRRISV